MFCSILFKERKKVILEPLVFEYHFNDYRRGLGKIEGTVWSV